MQSARDRLAEGDRFRQLISAGASLISIASAGSISPKAVSKAMWLAKAYDDATRSALGTALDTLTATHLEIVASRREPTRSTLLRGAAAEGMSVRRFRAVACNSEPAAPGTVVNVGGARDLVSARKAVEAYARFDDRALEMLLAGPNGTYVRDLVEANRCLAERLKAARMA